MGCRIVELKSPGYESDSIGWGVYQSTSMALFTPIFHNQVAAQLFARALGDIYPQWDETNQLELAAQVNAYITACFGEQPEEHELYSDCLCEEDPFDVIVSQFRAGWLKKVSTLPGVNRYEVKRNA